VATSLTTQGQGHLTTFAQVAADYLGVDPTHVDVIESDTTVTPYGTGTFHSRAIVVGSGAIVDACRRVREQVLAIAGTVLEASPSDLELENSIVSVRGVADRSLSLAQVARVAYGLSPSALPSGLASPALEASASYDPAGPAVAHGTHIAVVELDRETGFARLLKYVACDNSGRMVNPKIVEGQIVGGATQAIGEVLLEELIYDESGSLVTSSLMDYLVPSFDDVPPFFVSHLEVGTDALAVPFKGVGEGGVMGGVAAVASAIDDALRQCGARLDRIPASPARVRALLAKAGGSVPSA
jgi:carbon-monoxide dehydrogenase large subunit